MTSARMQLIEQRLRASLDPQQLELTDNSHLHAGHAGARDGRGHYEVLLVSDQFAGLRLVARHQLVYRALGDLMQTDIHALGITALTPAEAVAETRRN